VEVYEARRPSLDQRAEESYPIGVNLRGLRAIERVAGEAVAKKLQEEGRIVDSWDIVVGTFRVAQVESGACYSHTRFAVTKACYDAVVSGAQPAEMTPGGSFQSDASSGTSPTAREEAIGRVTVHFNKILASFDRVSESWLMNVICMKHLYDWRPS
jgi:hypothetical protein